MTDKKPSAPRVNKHRAELKATGKKPLSVMISESTHKRISDYATSNKMNQGAAVDSLLSTPSVTSNNSELQKEIDKLNLELASLRQSLDYAIADRDQAIADYQTLLKLGIEQTEQPDPITAKRPRQKTGNTRAGKF